MLNVRVLLHDRHRRAQERARADLTPAAWVPPYIGGASPATAAADRIVRVHALHESDEEGNGLGPYLDVVQQAVTYPVAEEEVFRFDYSEAEDPDEEWYQIYAWLVAGSPWAGVASWFAAHGITLGTGFTVTQQGEFEFTVTDGDTEYQVLSDETTDWDWVVTRLGGPEQVTYSDTLDDEEQLVTFVAYPDPKVMAGLIDDEGALIEGRELAEFYAVDQYLLAQPYGEGWVVWRSIVATAVVKVTDTSSDLTVIKQAWVDSAWADLGIAFVAQPHPGLTKEDYTVDDRYLAWRIGTEWFVGSREGGAFVVVKVMSTASTLEVRKQTWSGSAWADDGGTFTAKPHPEMVKGDYTVGDRYFAWFAWGECWVDPVSAATTGYTGTRTVVEDISFDADNCVDGFTTKDYAFVDGLLKTVS